jgi:uncharacterized protein (TIGR03437 family)
MYRKLFYSCVYILLLSAGLAIVVFPGLGMRLRTRLKWDWLKLHPVMAAASVNVTVNLAVQYQTMEGFGQAEPSSLVYPGVPPALSDSVRAIAIDKAFRQVGINMGTIGGLLESPGSYDQRQNDNSDPFATNWMGFNVDALTGAKRYLVDLAKPLGFTGYYLGAEAPNVRWQSPWLAPIRQKDYNRFLDEAAEQVVANVAYWRNTYGEELRYYQFGNEQLTGNHASINPDGSGYGSVDPTTQIVDLAKRAGSRLRAAGYLKTRFMVGTEETEETSFQVASAILADPQARQYVGAIGYHTYPYGQGYSSVPFILTTSGAGTPDAGRIAIRNRIRDLARQYSIGAWLTENSHGGIDPLSFDDCRARAIHIHDEFLYANAAAYFGEASMWDLASEQMHFGDSNLYGTDNEGNVVLINNTTGRVDITGIGYAIGHYARWVKPGAVRVDSQSDDPLVQVTTFRDDTSSRVSLVLINNSSAPTTVTVNINGGTLSGSMSGEQSTPAAFWTVIGAFAPDSTTAFHIVLPATSVTSIAGSMSGAASGTPQALIVSSASYAPGSLAPDSIASIFFSNLAITPAAAQSLPLPANLGGVSVAIRDAAGAVRAASLFYVSPNQINLQIMPGIALGPAVFTVSNATSVLASGTATIASLSPGLFSANGDGAGVAAAQVLRILPGGAQTVQPVFQCGNSPGSCRSVPVNLSPGQDQVFLIFYGTGIRNRVSLSNVVVKIGGVSATVVYAGPQSETPGLDQINVLAPVVHGGGDLQVQLSVGNIVANTVTVGVQ